MSRQEDFNNELDNIEFEKYEKSASTDDFKTWKIKKYIDKRIMQVYISIIAGIVGFILLTMSYN